MVIQYLQCGLTVLLLLLSLHGWPDIDDMDVGVYIPLYAYCLLKY